MKKIFVLLLMLTLFFTVSCDDDDGGVQGEAIPRNSVLIFHPNPDGDEDVERDVTGLEEYGKEDVRVFDKFRDVLSTGNSGWAAYRWSSDHAASAAGDDTADTADCNGAYKVSYLERAAENAYRFVGAGICLDGRTIDNIYTDGTYDGKDEDPPGDPTGIPHTDARIANLQKLVDDTTLLVDNISHPSSDTIINDKITETCGTHSTPTAIGSITDINNENGELYLFIAEVEVDGTLVSSVVSSVEVLCHPDSDIESTDIYEATDDSGRAYIKEVVDELFSLEIIHDPETLKDQFNDHVDEGVWSVHTAPKLNEAGNALESDTLNDPPKLSYFRISGNIINDDYDPEAATIDPANLRRFIVGAGIYLDENNENAADGVELEGIRSRVKEHAGVLLEAEAEAEAAEEEFNSDGTFFDNDDGNVDDTDFYSTAMLEEEEYIFVWENR